MAGAKFIEWAALEALGKGGRMVHFGTTVADRQLAGSRRRLVLLP